MPAFVLVWLVPVWTMIGMVSFAILLIPFRVLASRLGANLGSVALVPLANPAEEARARNIGRTIALAAKYAPFRADCLPQAIVAQALCRVLKIPSALHFGVALECVEGEGRKLQSHAWVVSGPVAISGGNSSFNQFATVGCFVSPRRVSAS